MQKRFIHLNHTRTFAYPPALGDHIHKPVRIDIREFECPRVLDVNAEDADEPPTPLPTRKVAQKTRRYSPLHRYLLWRELGAPYTVEALEHSIQHLPFHEQHLVHSVVRSILPWMRSRGHITQAEYIASMFWQPHTRKVRINVTRADLERILSRVHRGAHKLIDIRDNATLAITMGLGIRYTAWSEFTMGDIDRLREQTHAYPAWAWALIDDWYRARMEDFHNTTSDRPFFCGLNGQAIAAHAWNKRIIPRDWKRKYGITHNTALAIYTALDDSNGAHSSLPSCRTSWSRKSTREQIVDHSHPPTPDERAERLYWAGKLAHPPVSVEKFHNSWIARRNTRFTDMATRRALFRTRWSMSNYGSVIWGYEKYDQDDEVWRVLWGEDTDFESYVPGPRGPIDIEATATSPRSKMYQERIARARARAEREAQVQQSESEDE